MRGARAADVGLPATRDFLFYLDLDSLFFKILLAFGLQI